MRALAGVALALALALAVAGCGGGGKAGPPLRPDPSAKTGADGVIRAWADAVRKGDYAAANKLFALPATIANGTPGVKLTKPEQIDAFNRSLPCGAILLDTQPTNGGRTLATFRLTQGANGTPCGSGPDDKARVTFRIADGKIAEWLRAPTGPPPGSTET